MLSGLLLISLAPIFIIAIYVYIRDKYEKEPFLLLLKALFIGVLVILPVVLIEKWLASFSIHLEGLSKVAFHAFVIASLTEEGFKYCGFILIFWRDKNFNEKFDGIVYAMFISLGFAAIENILYVFQGGITIGIARALTAVPAHALFGTVMGYYFGLARFYPHLKIKYLILAFVMTFLWHGFYDFLLLSKNPMLLLLFIPLIIYFWINGFRKMKKLSDASFFRKTGIIQPDEPDCTETK
jgi:RsiW-degrading membrane proteinase PrsW (M82 family)